MKKLLTALCLCLALSLLCGAALAEAPAAEEPAKEAHDYTRFECVNGLPGVMRCFYGVDEDGNELYDDRPMTEEELVDPQYHDYQVDWNLDSIDFGDGWYNVTVYPQHVKTGEGEYKVTANGVASVKCARCGNEKTREIDWPHHQYDWDTYTETPATCVSPRHATVECKICGMDEWDIGEPDEMNHSWIQAQDKDGKDIITKATCEKAGVKTLVCEYCGTTKEVEILAREHEWGETEYVWDFEKGTLSAVQKCTNEETDEYEACKAEKVLETVKITGKLVNKDDCTEGREWTAEKFQDKDLEAGSPKTTVEEIKEHKFTAPTFTWVEAKDWTDPADKYTVKASYKCTVCTKEGGEEVKAAVTLKADTLCTAADKATYKATFSDEWITKWGADKKNADAYKAATTKVEPLAHVYEPVGIEWSKDNSKATLQYRCTRDNCPQSKADKDGKFQTKTINTVRKEDTTVPCDDENRVEWTADFSDMFKDLVETKNGPMEHEWDKPVLEKAGKNCDDVNVYVKWCKHCRLVSVKYTEPVAPVYGDKADKTIVKKIANEKADGTYCYEEETTEIFYCQNCGGFHYTEEGWENGEYPEHIKTVVTSKLVKEHDFELQEDDANAATCTAGGTLTYICKDCGYVKTEEVDALGHTWGEWKLVHKIGENGNELAYWTRSCEVCGEVDPLIIEKDELTCEDLKEKHTFAWTVVEGAHVYRCSKCGVVENKEIPESVHTWSEEPEITAATCLVDGKKVWTCEDCGITKEEVIKAAGKHTPGKEQIVTAATCVENGLSAVTCTVCSEVLETKTIPATGHTAGDPIITAATCTEAGKEEIKCSVCGTVLSSKEIPATGHTFGEWEITKEATCEEAGEKTRVCSVCGEKETEAIDALGHKLEKVEAVPADVEKQTDGVKEYYVCSVCGKKFADAEGTKEVADEDLVDSYKDYLGRPAYSIVDLAKNGNVVTGKIVHDPATEEAEELYVRVTFYMADYTFISGVYDVRDGSFRAAVKGDVKYIGVEVVGTYEAVDPDDTTWESMGSTLERVK